MKLLSADQIRELDQYTIKNEPIPSIELMERAASRCTEYLIKHFENRPFTVFAGTGNNGGDGLAIARQMDENDLSCRVFLVGNTSSGSPDFKTNLERLKLHPNIAVSLVNDSSKLPTLAENEVTIDTLFGIGLNRPADGIFADVIRWINEQDGLKVSIDLPSGMFADLNKQEDNEIIQAHHTLSFQLPKIPFLFDEHRSSAGRVHILDIGLDSEYHDSLSSTQYFITPKLIKKLRRSRRIFSHKKTYGHTLLIAGSKGKMGAALLAAGGALHGGAGLLSCFIPSSGIAQMNIRHPEAMLIEGEGGDILTSALKNIEQDVLVIGPGLGLNIETAKAIGDFLRTENCSFVLDADALNALAEKEDWWKFIRGRAILTPHPGEFERLANCGKNQIDQYNALKKMAKEKEVVIILKGSFTRVAFPDGSTYFNSTGNPGMATAGSGDVLAGLCGGILSSGYTIEDAALLGTFIHGKAGDIAADLFSQEALTASMISENIGIAWKFLD